MTSTIKLFYGRLSEHCLLSGKQQSMSKIKIKHKVQKTDRNHILFNANFALAGLNLFMSIIQTIREHEHSNLYF